ncbi:hypothetical protein [Hymenobacter sp. B81]|uniref:hypothetical protein n=1 Tax=Hymenobacter sp. B81 TaxID=3344878 RepID=UPI0037DCDD6B
MKLLLTATLLLLLWGCKKEKTPLETLPPATQQGLNRMGCLIDGAAWQPRPGGLFAPTPIGVSRWPVEGHTTLSFIRFEDGGDKSSVSLYVPRLRQPGTYALDQFAVWTNTWRNPPYGQHVIEGEVPGTHRDFYTGPEATGTLVVTRLDTVARIVAGTFEMTVREAATGETKRLTHGRFDLTYPQ